MSAQPDLTPAFRPMELADFPRIMTVEREVYPYPWTPGNFTDSIRAGYCCRIMECGGEMTGYGVLAMGAGEAHLLNLSVASAWQRQGLGNLLLRHFIGHARGSGAAVLLLEVRPSNVPARRLYAAAGFRQVGLRKGYYPAMAGREDALVLELPL